MYRLLITAAGLLLLNACQQQIYLTVDNKSIASGRAEAELRIEPNFNQYLKDLDLFAGEPMAEQEDILPTFISRSLADLRNKHADYKEDVQYQRSTAGFTIDYSFSYSNFSDIFTFGSDSRALVNRIISYSTAADGTTTLKIYFDKAAREQLQAYYPELLPVDGYTKESYIKELAKTIASSLSLRSAAEREIMNSYINVVFMLPQPVKEAENGLIDKIDRNKAYFNIRLVDILYPEKALTYILRY
jgi:hypothetical protein